VVYPALDSKVKNVTVAYSVEHQDEVGLYPGILTYILPFVTLTEEDLLVPTPQELLFEQLAHQVSTATAQKGQERTETIR
jgi:hypothetical protein